MSEKVSTKTRFDYDTARYISQRVFEYDLREYLNYGLALSFEEYCRLESSGVFLEIRKVINKLDYPTYGLDNTLEEQVRVELNEIALLFGVDLQKLLTGMVMRGLQFERIFSTRAFNLNEVELSEATRQEGNKEPVITQYEVVPILSKHYSIQDYENWQAYAVIVGIFLREA